MFERKILNTANAPWEGRITPFRIIGNVWFIGTYQASSHLIDTGDGLVLIDTGYANTLYLLINSIYSLGFNPCDIKYIINTHWHGDHTAATAALAELSGAKTIIGDKDYENALRYFNPDIRVRDGDILTLGNTSFRFVETPGHTRGTISIFFETCDNGKKYNVGTFGGAGANTLIKGHFDYPECREDYLASIKKLRGEKVDIFIGNHVWNNDTERKGLHLLQTGENLFIDIGIWTAFLDFCERRLLEKISQGL